MAEQLEISKIPQCPEIILVQFDGDRINPLLGLYKNLLGAFYKKPEITDLMLCRTPDMHSKICSAPCFQQNLVSNP